MAVSDSYVQVVDQPNVNLETENLLESLPQETKERIAVLREKGEPVNILVFGPTGSGKSTLINNLMRKTMAKARHGAASVTSEVKEYEGEYEGVKIRVYDTVGFSDTKGKSNQSIIKEIADAGEFDLVLICVRMDCRAYGDVRNMFRMLGKKLNEEMWKRSVIVLTFYNIFLQLGTVEDSGDVQKAVQDEIENYQTVVSGILSGSVKGEVISGIPYCVAGRKVTSKETWLPVLWCVCLKRCSDKSQPLLKGLSMNELILIMGIGAVAYTGIVAGIEAGIDAVKSAATAAGGATVGAFVGAFVGAGIGAAVVNGVGVVIIVGGVKVVAD